MVGDALLSALVLLLSVAGIAPQHHWPTYLLVSALLSAPLLVRRRHPRVSAALVLAVGAVQLFAMPGTVIIPADIALAVALYTLVNYVGRRAGLLYSLGLVVGTVLWGLWRANSRLDVFAPLMVFAMAWVLAEFAGARRAYATEVEMRLAEAERERDRRSSSAVSDERTRIARELHDVVAHAVSIMVVQADGASYVLPRDPAAAAAALKTISSTGRTALTELRRTLDLLRTDHSGALTPQPGTVGLRELTQRMQGVGLPVDLQVHGDLDTVPTGLALGVYRIVQESLTNVLRHAGAGAKAAVVVRRDEQHVVVEVSDTGGGAGPHGDDAYQDGSGNGLLGMRERVAVLGGSISVGPRPDGGWTVRATLPLQVDSGHGEALR